MRWAWAEVDLDAIRHNVEVVRRTVAPARVWAVVKADAYGHGAVPVARAALAAGAEGLCVAFTQEGIELRNARIDAPILLLTQQPEGELDDVVSNALTPTVYSREGIDALANAAASAGLNGHEVHLKIDTGMHRVGVQPDEAAALAAAITRHRQLDFAGVFTHLAVADEPNAPSNPMQLRRFDDVLERLERVGRLPRHVHVANSAVALSLPAAHRGFVRLGIAMYGIEPGPGVGQLSRGLRPAMSLRARVSLVKRVAAGEGVSYGLRHGFQSDTRVATIPIGYADGVPRRLFGTGGEVLIHGRRRPIVGVVTMDQLMVDCGDLDVAVGDEVVLIGRQTGARGEDEIRAEEWASKLGTIGYEIVCGISKRIERRHRGSPRPENNQ